MLMRVVMLLDRPFARRERRLMSRLEIGLANEGVRVIHAVPSEIVHNEPVGLYSRLVGYEHVGFPVPLRVRARRFAETIREAIDDDQGGGGGGMGVGGAAAAGGGGAVDVVHSFSPAVWRLGLDLATELGAGAALEVWSTDAIARAGEVAGHPLGPVLTVGDSELAALLRRRAPGAEIRETLWGVHGETVSRHEVSADRAVALLMIVDRSSPAYLEAALRGLAEVCRRDPRVLAFINTERSTGHAVWKLIRRLELVDRVSLIPDAESRREAVLRLDGLVIAEPGGRLRSMALDAMATGMPVVAAADASLGVLRDGVNAHLVGRPDGAEWAAAIGSIVEGREEVERLRRSALAWVIGHRSANSYISSVLGVYDSIVRARAEAVGVGGAMAGAA